MTRTRPPTLRSGRKDGVPQLWSCKGRPVPAEYPPEPKYYVSTQAVPHLLYCPYLFDSANENLEVGPNFKADTTQPHPHFHQVRDFVIKIIRLRLRESDHCNHPIRTSELFLNTCLTVSTLFSIFRSTLLIFKYDTYLSVV